MIENLFCDSPRLKSLVGYLFGMALLVALLLALIALSHPFGEFPVNDDWICAKDVLAFLALGYFKYLGCESALFMPQILLGAGVVKVFGFSFFILRCVGWGALCVSGLGLFRLLRSAGAARVNAVICVALLTLFPTSFFNASSFMTDTLFLCLWIWGLVLICALMRRGGVGRIAVVALTVLAAVLQRQFGVCLGLVALWSAYRSRPDTTREGRRMCVLVGVLAICACVMVQLWWNSHERIGDVRFKPGFMLYRMENVVKGGTFLGLLALPFFRLEPIKEALCALRDAPFLGRAAVVGIVAFFLVQVIVLGAGGHFMPYFGNQLSAYGTLGPIFFSPTERDVLLALPIQYVLTLGGIVGVVFLVAQLVDFYRERASQGATHESSVAEILIVSALLYGSVLGVTNLLWFDRYLLPLFPAALFLAQRNWEGAAACRAWMNRYCARVRLGPLNDNCGTCRPKLSAVRTLWLLACMMGLGFWTIDATQSHFSLYRARWALAESAVQDGMAPTEIRGGYEWDGWHRDLALSGRPRGGIFGLFEAFPAKAYITLQPASSDDVLRYVDFDRLPIHSPGRLYLRRVDPGSGMR